MRGVSFHAAAALLAAALAAGWPGAAHAQPPPGGTTLRVAITQDIDSLNPFVAVFLSSTQVMRLTYENLTMVGPDNAVQPGFAESWQSSPDGLTWTFKIRDAQWSDGTPITARDVAFTYTQIMTNPAAQDANGSAVANFAAVTAVDDRTVEITTKEPQASILASDVPIVPEHVWSSRVGQIGTATNAEQLPAVGSGPYVISGYQEGQSVTLSANDRFWRGRAHVDTLQFVRYENADAAVQGLLKGDVDLVRDLTPAQFDSLEGNAAVGRNEGRNRRYTELLLNWSNPSGVDGQPFGDGHPALRDVRVRKALHHAVDAGAIVDRVKQGHSEPGHGIIPPVYPKWTFTPSDSQRRDHDPERAKALLDQAGYRPGPDGVRVGPDGRPLTLRLIAGNQVPTNPQLLDFLAGWFEAVGVGVTPQIMASNQIDDATVAGNFDIAVSGWSVNPDPDSTLDQQTCAVNGTSRSDSGYCNPAYDQLYAEQQAALDEGKRREIVQRMQSLLYDDVHAIVLTHDALLEAYRADRFTGFVTQPEDGGVITGQTGYWGYYGATPVAAPRAAADAGGGTGLLVGVLAAVVVLGAGAFLVARNRRRSRDERE
ncbi:ABC transporter substrate-binding protein [Pseudonocardia cypriaca]|uniref:Peptide/nickel transport system substrate-binding protein n=1 Tax=Pseudonocardia cypriaca TaxID=882449 RepID=A0A543FVN2_9PSEU|nr:ABC transporter substrate-binding protein [Pseudonocardia cypriaca]TQM37886.1 peptide/nickel transport system substrate-binding protein [Pseudonocardia cypriaca]